MKDLPINFKDENKWSDNQERNIALRKARSIQFFNLIRFAAIVLIVGFGVLTDFKSEFFEEAWGAAIFFGLIAYTVFSFFRIRYIRYKYKT